MDMSKYDLTPFVRDVYWGKSLEELQNMAKEDGHAAFELGERFRRLLGRQTLLQDVLELFKIGQQGSAWRALDQMGLQLSLLRGGECPVQTGADQFGIVLAAVHTDPSFPLSFMLWTMGGRKSSHSGAKTFAVRAGRGRCGI